MAAADGSARSAPLPPETRQAFSLDDGQGGRLATFEGESDCDSCQQFYAKWLTGQGAAGDWRRSDTGWHGHFASVGTLKEPVTIVLQRQPHHGTSGFIAFGSATALDASARDEQQSSATP